MDCLSPILEIQSGDDPPSAPRNHLNVGSRKYKQISDALFRQTTQIMKGPISLASHYALVVAGVGGALYAFFIWSLQSL
jgi:hypothetical protein